MPKGEGDVGAKPTVKASSDIRQFFGGPPPKRKAQSYPKGSRYSALTFSSTPQKQRRKDVNDDTEKTPPTPRLQSGGGSDAGKGKGNALKALILSSKSSSNAIAAVDPRDSTEIIVPPSPKPTTNPFAVSPTAAGAAKPEPEPEPQEDGTGEQITALRSKPAVAASKTSIGQRSKFFLPPARPKNPQDEPAAAASIPASASASASGSTAAGKAKAKAKLFLASRDPTAATSNIQPVIAAPRAVPLKIAATASLSVGGSPDAGSSAAAGGGGGVGASQPSKRRKVETSNGQEEALSGSVAGRHAMVFDEAHPAVGVSCTITPTGVAAAACVPGPGYIDGWDEFHVRLPCSPRFTSIESVEGGPDVERPRWVQICRALSGPMTSAKELVRTIRGCNPRRTKKWRFDGLYALLEDELTAEAKAQFFKATLPRMVALALALPDVCPIPIPLLRQGAGAAAVSLTSQQAACLLAHAFFCNFPDGGRLRPYLNRFNFKDLFATAQQAQLAKLRCVLQYFEVVVNEAEPRVVTIARCSIGPDKARWPDQKAMFKGLDVRVTDFIEDVGWEYSQVDFANKMIGGGVLGHGAVQEEIRFMICPELLISCLLCEKLGDRECVVIKGAERFSNYSGYSYTFAWTGRHVDPTQLDSMRRRETQVLAIDAVHFGRDGDGQWDPRAMARELDKCLCGFGAPQGSSGLNVVVRPVATGNWGCGAFGGDPELKAVLQLCACAVVEQNMIFCSFGAEAFSERLRNLHELLLDRGMTVGEVYSMLVEYCATKRAGRRQLPEVLEFLCVEVSNL